MRILLPHTPKETTLTDSKGEKLTDIKSSWDAASQTLYISFENSPDGTKLKYYGLKIHRLREWLKPLDFAVNSIQKIKLKFIQITPE